MHAQTNARTDYSARQSARKLSIANADPFKADRQTVRWLEAKIGSLLGGQIQLARAEDAYKRHSHWVR